MPLLWRWHIPSLNVFKNILGNVSRFVFRNFPLVESHPHAGIAAMTAEFAATQNKFWEMHDILYENQEALDIPDLLSYAKSLDLSATDLQMAIENETFTDKIKNDFMGGVRSGVNGTPLFLLMESVLMVLLSMKIF